MNPPRWTQMPNDSGYWYFAPDLTDWDVKGKITGVERHEYGCGTAEWWTTPYSTRQKITPEMGYWFGPFKIARPTAEDATR